MINSLSISAAAKLNLYLHLHKKLKSGYHSISSFIIFINLFDNITFKESNKTLLKIKGPLSKSFANYCSTNNNSVINVVNYLKDKFKLNKEVEITLEKHIPIGAGLGGASVDAAATLRGLNVLWDLKLDNTALTKIAKQFGADTPACLHSKSSIIEGIGDKITPLSIPDLKLPILLINNLKHLSTKEVYNNIPIINNNKKKKKAHIPSDISANKNIFLNFIKQQNNDLTNSAVSILPEIQNILKELNNTNPFLSRMTGSGSTCFAIYKSKQDLKIAVDKLRSIYPNYLITTAHNI